MRQDRLRRLRLLKGMTQTQLARELGVSTSAVGMYEQGRREPDHKTLARMAKLFETSTDFLLGTEPERQKGFEDLLREFKTALIQQEGLMFNGVLLEDGDVEKIMDAIRMGAQLVVSQKKECPKDG